MSSEAATRSRPILLALESGDRRAARKALEAAGFRQPDETLEHLLALRGNESLRAHAEDILVAALGAADPAAVLLGLRRYAEACRTRLGRSFAFEPGKLRLLVPVLGASRFLTQSLENHPEDLDVLAASPWLDREITAEALREAIRAESAHAAPGNGSEASIESLQRVLRRVRAREMLRIAARDLTGRGDVVTIMRELTLLAECTLDEAVRGCDAQLRRRYGVPSVETVGGDRVEGEFVVIGMGKLGARELNFSSDVDLMYAYSSSKGETAGGAGGERIGAHAYYVKLSELVTRAMGELTQDGFVFRVDLNLRPDGSKGQLANSLMAYEVYYASWGEIWERSALLRARPVAGNLRLGEEFVRVIEPIVYRKTLDMGMLEDMRQMKQRIDAESRRTREGAWNVKLGGGGIREIEFLVNALQLVYAGRNVDLRVTETLLCLERLQAADLLSGEEAQDLAEAYRFYRKLEHRIQMLDDRQTHLLTARGEDRNRIARAMGFFGSGCAADDAGFDETLRRHRENVSGSFRRVLAVRESEAKEEAVSPALRDIVELKLPAAEDAARLGMAGFEDPETAAARLVWLRDPPVEAGLSVRSRRHLRRHAPAFLQAILESPDPDRALAHLERFFLSTQARYKLFTVLAAQRETLRLLIRLFGMSDYLSDAFIQHPELLDSLVLSSYAKVKKSRAETEVELWGALTDVDSLEERLDVLRRFKRGENLRIAFNDLSGTLSRPQVSAQLSDLADACLAAAMRLGRAELDERFGAPTAAGRPGESARFALLGLGKLGGREIDYLSDLDIIFVFDPNGETSGGARARRITNFEYFVKLGQRIISLMALKTGEGTLYEVDTRLRPSGNAGALVTSLDGFERYHETSAKLWERQALIKARFVAGDAELGERLEGLARSFAYEGPWRPEDRQEIARIRQRMEKEIAREKPGHYNMKTGRGGLVDVEFVVQALQLEHARDDREVQMQNTMAALGALRRAGRLPEAEARDLEEGYVFLRTLEDRLRLLHNRSTSALGTGGADLEKLARRLGFEAGGGKTAGEVLLGAYQLRTERIRAIYSRVFED